MLKKNQKNTNPPLKNYKLSTKEKMLIEAIGLSEKQFLKSFNDLILSEILPNSKEKGVYRDSINGIIFCGKKIELDHYLSMRKEFEKKGLVLEVSIDVMFYYRYPEFKFPNFDKETIENIPKNYYKIYEKDKGLHFTEQCYYVKVDKTELEEFYGIIVNKYNGFAIWADNEENLLYVPNNKSSELINLIYNFRDNISPKKYGIENGWYTEEGLKNDIKERLPLIDFGFYE